MRVSGKDLIFLATLGLGLVVEMLRAGPLDLAALEAATPSSAAAAGVEAHC